MVTFYGYSKCSTCLRAKKFLKTNGLNFKDIEITDQPPSALELKRFLSSGKLTLRDLFNRSGQLYREMDLKTKLPAMNESEMLTLLSKNGKLIKRPLMTDGKKFTAGFTPETEKQWARP